MRESLTESLLVSKTSGWRDLLFYRERKKERKEGGSERDCSLLDLIVAHQPG